MMEAIGILALIVASLLAFVRFGLPALIGVLAFVAAISAAPSAIGVFVAGLSVLVVLLIIGAAITLAGKR
jgi:hypothetical protein